MPDKYKGRLHFYNTAFSADILEDASHPLNMMRSLYNPGDMFVVKLDIDNVPLEFSVLEAIEADPSILQMIAEMFFEGHYDHAGNPDREHTHSHTLQCRPHQDSLALSSAIPNLSAHHACTLVADLCLLWSQTWKYHLGSRTDAHWLMSDDDLQLCGEQASACITGLKQPCMVGFGYACEHDPACPGGVLLRACGVASLGVTCCKTRS